MLENATVTLSLKDVDALREDSKGFRDLRNKLANCVSITGEDTISQKNDADEVVEIEIDLEAANAIMLRFMGFNKERDFMDPVIENGQYLITYTEDISKIWELEEKLKAVEAEEGRLLELLQKHDIDYNPY